MRIIGRRLLNLIPVILLVTLGTTLLLELIPGDPALVLVGPEATPEQIAAVHEQLNLDEPLLERYLDWLWGALHLDFGTSYRTGQPVWEAVTERLPTTLELAILANIVALTVALPVGIYSAYRNRGKFDRAATVASSIVVASPAFLTGLLLSYFFAMKLQILPVTGWEPIGGDFSEHVTHIILPVLTLALTEIAIYSQLVRSDMTEILREEYIAAASAKGLRARYILFRHALKPASFTLFTIASLSFARLLGGAVIVESIFALPGLGSLVIQSIGNRDLPVIQGVVFFVALMYVLINAFVDLIYVWLDPRARTTAAA